MKLSLKILKKLAAEKDKKIVYNRSLGGYQVGSGFFYSEAVCPARDEKGKIWLSQSALSKLKSFI